MQRVPRYILLLTELKKNTSEHHADYGDIDDALNMITEITEKLNSEKKRIENMSQCLQIQRTLVGLEHPIIDRENIRLFEGQFILIKKNGNRRRQFFLFNDILIIANIKDRVKNIVSMRTIDIKRSEDEEDEFTLIAAGSDKPNVYIAKSAFELQQIETIIKKNRLMVWNKDLLQLNAKTMKKLLSAQKLKHTSTV